MPVTKRIQPGQRVAVAFSAAEKRLVLERTLADPEYMDRLRPRTDGSGFVGEFTLGDLDDILGYLAAEANHTENERLQQRLDKLSDRLQAIMESYDDGGWQKAP